MMSERASGESFMHIPADERRLAGAQDIYQTARRIRPTLKAVFKAGGLLDNLVLDEATITDQDSFHTVQIVAGRRIKQMHASRTHDGIYSAAEIGYLRHIPSGSPRCAHNITNLLAATREVALVSCAYLDLPPFPAVTLDPVWIPPPTNFLYGGIFENFRHSEDMQPIKSAGNGTVQPMLVWKLDPYPGLWSPDDSPATRQPFIQGDLIVANSGTPFITTHAQNLAFIQPESKSYRSLVYEHVAKMAAIAPPGGLE